jgi:hypothetical protein
VEVHPEFGEVDDGWLQYIEFTSFAGTMGRLVNRQLAQREAIYFGLARSCRQRLAV